MQISIPITKFDINNVLFCNRAENTVIIGGSFYRIMYCSKDLTILGVHILFDVDVNIENIFDTREAVNKVSSKTLLVLSGLITEIYDKWYETNSVSSQSSIKNPKPSPSPLTINNVENIVTKSVEHYRKHCNINGNGYSVADCGLTTLKIPFIFKCSGVYDTNNDVGISFKLSNHDIHTS